MARKTTTVSAGRRMLSLWEPPANAGQPVGVLATTYTFDTVLFEEECLTRFAGVQSDPARDGALYRIEREEKLAGLLCAAVVADIHHCSGRRSLRWDLLASRPLSGVMHAKISVLAWERHVRVIVASANLTPDGYRRNQECASVLDFDASGADRALLDPLLVYLRDILATTAAGKPRERAEQLLDWLDRQLTRAESVPKGLQRRLVLLGPGRPDLFEQLVQHLPAGRATVAHVVSPFFDPESRAQGPTKKTWEMLRQRGDAELHLHVGGEFAAETGRWRLAVPDHVVKSVPAGRPGVHLALHPIPVTGVPTDGREENRPLHAKAMTLCHPDWIAWMVGSSNFTSPGTGLNPRRVNFEANVVYILKAPETDALYRQMATGGLRGGDAVDAATKVDFQPVVDEAGDEVTPILPPFFGEADLHASQDGIQTLALGLRGAGAPDAWCVRHDKHVVLDATDWREAGEPASLTVTFESAGAPPSLLTVEWSAEGAVHVAGWPVNVACADALPAPDELRNLSLAALLELLTSARPIHELLRAWLRRSCDDDEIDGFDACELTDPHAKVDTSGFLVKRVQRACAALEQLRERLGAPVLSEAALAWRLEGPVGARAVVEAIRRQCDPDLPDEWTFLLSELVRELGPLRLKGAPPAIAGELQARFDAFVLELRGQLRDALDQASEAMRRYAGMEELEARCEPA